MEKKIEIREYPLVKVFDTMLLRNGKIYVDDMVTVEESIYSDSTKDWELYFDSNFNYYIVNSKVYDIVKQIYNKDFKTKKECRDFAYSQYNSQLYAGVEKTLA